MDAGGRATQGAVAEGQGEGLDVKEALIYSEFP